jgi:quinol-cytochrome oxidoreductase complex cytochrome b subunit
MIKSDVQSDVVTKTAYFSVAAAVVVFVFMLLLTLIHP